MQMATSKLIHLPAFCVVSLVIQPGRISAEDSRPLQVQIPEVSSVAISPDGKVLAAGGSVANRDKNPLSCQEGIVKLWDIASGGEKATHWLSGRRKSGSGYSDVLNWVGTLVFSPDGKYLVAGDRLGYTIWEVTTGKEHLRLEDGFSHTGVAFSPDGKTLAVPANGIGALKEGVREGAQGVRLVELVTSGEGARLPHGGSGEIFSVAFSPDGKLLATSGSDCNLTVWDVRAKSILFKDSIGWVLNSCNFSPDGSLLVAAGEGGVVKVYKLRTQDKQVRVEKQKDRGYLDAIFALVFPPDGKKLLLVGQNRIHVWDPVSWRRMASLKGNSVAISRDGKLVAIGGIRHGMVEVGDAIKLVK